MNRDFTLIKYQYLLESIHKANYATIGIQDYLKFAYDRCIIMRHDVDRKPIRALKMAKIENKMGMKSTYYFRTTKEVFQPQIIKQIAELGHEIGYHYEVLDTAKGDIKKAITIFEQELGELREIAEVTTICMHGNPLTSWVNRDIWKDYDFKDFDIIGEAYLSIDYNKVSYFTDTGRAWNSSRHSIKDIVKNSNIEIVRSTDELITLIENSGQKNICIVTHPNRWTDKFDEWLVELIWQNIKNLGKTAIKHMGKLS